MIPAAKVEALTPRRSNVMEADSAAQVQPDAARRRMSAGHGATASASTCSPIRTTKSAPSG